ncbi:hypothetical protein NHX12_005673 [Muraenolepis orangiensis]|uniref:Uncharacterized protein n=1 Tax=Muraenolepis orangiensis TaxID=630683 RepID=A0A9Q0ID50_9TELE|nr:hypothetical protein NHX12_005673 [Muraenolepis orangiensis]
MNSFTVLPPVRAPHQVRFGDSAAGAGSAPAGSSVVGVGGGGGAVSRSASGSRGVGRTGERGGADSVTDPGPSRDTHRAMAPPTAVYRQAQENRRLFSTLAVPPVLKRYEGPLGGVSDSVQRTTFSLGRHWKQALRTGSEYGRHTRPTTPQLPVLFGTKVPIVVSGQRPL